MDLDLPTLHGIVPPLPTPLTDDERIDVEGLERLVGFHLAAGVHGLWALGTTGRFDLISDPDQRETAAAVARVAAGRVPLVLNVSDQGTRRTCLRAERFDDLPYDYYAVLPPWYQVMTPGEVQSYFLTLADRLARPVVIYNPPWVCNQLSFELLKELAAHPRIVGVKDVGPSLTRAIEWPRASRRRLGFSYLHGNDMVAESTDLGADGFVITLSAAFPELTVAIWEAAKVDDAERAFRLQMKLMRLSAALTTGPSYLAGIEAAMRARGLLTRMLPHPLRSLDATSADRVVAILDRVGVLTDREPVGAI